MLKHLLYLVREITINKKLSKVDKNCYTVLLLDAFTNQEAMEQHDQLKSVYMVFEHVQFDMKELLESATEIDEEQATIMVYNLLLSLNFVHKGNVIHRDLKPSNILVTSSCTIKLCDFGLSRLDLQGSDSRKMSPVCYTRYYRPPEVILQHKTYDSKADVWSLGCLIFEIFKHSSMDADKLKNTRSKLLFNGGSCFPISPLNESDDCDD